VLERDIINAIRVLVDGGKLEFFLEETHPRKLPQFFLPSEEQSKASQSEIRDFLQGKIYWLGFRQGDKNTAVWIADPWDAEYLGVDQNTLVQTAQLLEAEEVIKLCSEDKDFASAGRQLLLRAEEFEHLGESGNRLSTTIGEKQGQWDLFVCHASEDKDDFVRPLAAALKKKGLSVWFDEFTLKLGDRLRQSIDRGLAQSRYGIVVLSPSFFAKQWPQWELDGLVAREVDGKKVILPVWHKVTREDVYSYSPLLSDRLAAASREGIESVVAKIIAAIQ
jgi:hypothetical protein